ncbi:MAG: CusA/CzcA family heavy metal efflux RND transporter [Flavobacteriia bacterium]|nr:CusA/CzcA family heavy metal efflux RND transporter [Flavobacteriia bacterium]
MFNKIIAWSVTNKLFVILLTLALIVWGIFSLNKLPIDAVPDITNNQVQIITSSPSTGAEDIEQFVTFPIEQTMATIPEIEEIRSFSRFGLSVVTIVFKEETDIYWARQQVNERLVEAKSSIPGNLGEPFLAPLSSGLGEIYQYIVHPKEGYEQKYNATELRTIQDWIIRRQLLGIKGVADVSGFGGHLKQYEIQVIPDQLKQMGVSISEIFKSLEENNQNEGGGYIERENNTTYIRTQGLLKSKKDIESIKIKENKQGFPILIRDIAKVEIGSALRYGALTNENKGEAVGGIVMMLKGANSSEVIGLVKERIEEIEKNLPQGIEIEVYLDRTKLVNNAISTVVKNLTEGALIVIFVLVLLLGNLRAGLIVASVIPIAMLFAISLMNLFGVSGNLMSLGAIDFGLIVDGSVIIVEATLHLIHAKSKGKLTQKAMNETVIFSASKFSNSAVFGQVIILVVYLPLLALVGIEGKMFKPMAQTVLFAILGAFILSLTYIPMMSALFLSKKVTHKENFSDKIVKFFADKYKPALQYVIRNQKKVLVILVSIFVFSFILFSKMGSEFIPNLDEGDFAVEMRMLPGTSLSKTIKTTQRASVILKKNFPEVKKVVGKIGTAEIPTDPMPMEACDLMVILKDKDEWVSASTKEELAEKMQAKLESYIPGVEFGFQQPIQMRFNELMTGAKQDVVVKVYGEDLDQLASYAKKIGHISSKIDGVQDLYVEEVTGLTELIVSFNHEQLAFYNVSVQDVNDVIHTSFAGKTAGLIFEGEKRFDLVVKNDSEKRQSIEDLKALIINTDDGKQIPLELLADVVYKIGPNQIQRDDAKRRVIVGFNIRGRDVASIIDELKQKIENQVVFEPGYHTTYGGTFKNLENARARLMIAVPVSLLLIFILLYVTFNSIKQALLIYTAIPLASIGGILALWLRDMPFSISAGVGFIALFGVAVLNGIVLIAEFNSILKEGEKNILKVIMKGTRARLRPVLLTAMVASLGFLPMALSHGSGAEVQKPLATVVIGGLVSATILTLFILPILYLISNRKIMINRKKGLLTLLILLSFSSFKAQDPLFAAKQMNVEECVKMALENNKLLGKTALEEQRQLFLAKGQLEVPKTNLNFMMGQFNSINKEDNNISINQSIPFPTVYIHQKRLGSILASDANLQHELAKASLALEVRLAFQELICASKRLKILQKEDSLFQLIGQKMKLKMEVSEINTIEFLLFQNQKNLLTQRLSKLENDYVKAQYGMQLLIGMEVLVEPILGDNVLVLVDEKLQFSNHQLLKTYENKLNELNLQQKSNRSASLPDISFGYFNQTLIGTQQINGTDVYFDGSKRFQGFQAGVSVPIINIATKRKNQAINVEKSQISIEKEGVQLRLENEYLHRYKSFISLQNRTKSYQDEILQNNKQLKSKSNLSYQNGEISQIEWLYTQQLLLDSELEFVELENEKTKEYIYLIWLKNQN